MAIFCRYLGGPLDGEFVTTDARRVEVEGHPGMAYHATGESCRSDPDYFTRGRARHLPPPSIVAALEWRALDWVSPAAAAVMEAFGLDRLDPSPTTFELVSRATEVRVVAAETREGLDAEPTYDSGWQPLRC